MALQAGLGGAAKQFYRRHRTLAVAAVWLASVLATAIMAFLALPQLRLTLSLTAGGALLAILPLWRLTRHFPLSAALAMAPLPGLAIAALFPAKPPILMPLAYGFVFLTACFFAENKLARLLRTGPGAVALWPPVAAAFGLAAALAALWFYGKAEGHAALQLLAAIAAALLSAAILIPLTAASLSYPERFIVRANRAREARGRRFEWLGLLGEGRWGLSLSGVTAVLLTLGWFGMPGGVQPEPRWLGALALTALAAALIARGWREAIAVCLAASAAIVLLFWAAAAASRPAGLIALAASAFFAVFALYSLWRTRCYRLSGETLVSARRRALEEAGGVKAGLFGGLAAQIPFAAAGLGDGALAMAAIAVTGIAGSVLCPAIVTGLEALLPRRRSFEELYGRK